jgi:hypothetical protein
MFMHSGVLVKNEALRLFLAITALLLTGLLTNPLGSIALNETLQPEIAVTQKPASPKKKAQENRSKASRTFAFYFRR